MYNIGFIIISFLIFKSQSKSYRNYSLFQVVPTDSHDIVYLESMQYNYDVNFWRPVTRLNFPVDFIVSPDDRDTLLEDAKKHGLQFNLLLPDVQKAFDAQTVSTYRKSSSTMNWKNYYRLDDIYSWMQDLKDANPDTTTLMNIGKTYEGRDIKAIRIMLKPKTDLQEIPTVIVEGGIHAREWISIAVSTFLIDQLLSKDNTTKSKDFLNLALQFEWIIVPVLNPDGYEYSHTTERLWRKNRNCVSKDVCGVDINRNFDVAFGTVGVSSDPKEEIFCGKSAFSEEESKAMKKLAKENSQNLMYFLSFHSYGQNMILPYAHTKMHLGNYDTVAAVCEKVKNAIYTRFKTIYTYGTAFDTVGYMTSGVSGCWIKKSFDTQFVVTFELRDKTGTYGFALPPDQIEDTCLETLDGVLELLQPKYRNKDSETITVTQSPLKVSSAFRNVISFKMFFNVFAVLVLLS